jgi:uncharacterized SAM-binding protein YcdF (DUF218 family)
MRGAGWSYLQPALPLLLWLGLIGVFRAWRNSKTNNRPWLITVSIFGIFLLSWNPCAWLLSQTLERWYDADPIPHDTADAIVVLAGAVNSPADDRPYPLAGRDTYIRIQHAVWLFKHWAARPILACGGGPDSESYSHTMRHLLETEGIPPDFIWIEDRSRTTHENAVYGADILRKHGISRVVLAMDARSMLRAAAAFRKQGIAVVPAPFEFYDLDFSLEDILPTWRAIEANGETVHELAGLAWYGLRGWI